MKSGIGVQNDPAKLVVVETLCNLARGNVDHQSGAPRMVGDDTVGIAAFEEVIRDVSPARVHKPRLSRV